MFTRMKRNGKKINDDHKTSGAGRPTPYNEGHIRLVYKLCLLGAIDTEIADILGVTVTTLNNWKNKYPEFFEALKKGKREADAEIAHKLYWRAKGYSHPEEKVFNNGGDILRAKTVKHHPPDTTAAIFWLKNRQPALWRDQKAVELSGKDGGPIELKRTYKFVQEIITNPEAAREQFARQWREKLTTSKNETGQEG